MFRSLFLDFRWWWRIGWYSVTWGWLTVLRLFVLLLSCCVHPWLVGWLNHCDSILFLYKSHLKNYNIIERGDFICASMYPMKYIRLSKPLDLSQMFLNIIIFLNQGRQEHFWVQGQNEPPLL